MNSNRALCSEQVENLAQDGEGKRAGVRGQRPGESSASGTRQDDKGVRVRDRDTVEDERRGRHMHVKPW